MKLELFDFIEETMSYFEENKSSYEYVEEQLKIFFSAISGTDNESVLSLRTRVKSFNSLREKLIRNRFYQFYQTPQEALNNLSDLIGVTLQCRFIRNETVLYQQLFNHFDQPTKGYSQSLDNPNVYLNLRMPQPQTQRNGFTIYRIDGYYMFRDERVNFELQIKSLVHNFWSEIEHEVVYKNPDFVIYDSFNKNMLGAIRDNLDVVDRQLEIMYNEISYQSQQAQIGMDEKGFKTFVAQSINELVIRKMKESLGFATDFKKCAAVLAQYIYIRDFVNGNNNPEKMIDYLELLNFLINESIDFQETVELEHEYQSQDPFSNALGTYWQKQMNQNFQWHVFFCMLFTIQPGNNIEDFTDFIEVIRILYIQPSWYQSLFKMYSVEEANDVRNDFKRVLGETLVSLDRVEIVHEDKIHKVMMMFRDFMKEIEERYVTYDAYLASRQHILAQLEHRIIVIFQ